MNLERQDLQIVVWFEFQISLNELSIKSTI